MTILADELRKEDLIFRREFEEGRIGGDIMSIKLEHINYVYSEGTAYEKHALKDVSLEIPHGEFVGIIGHTGSGKSTLIQHLNGLIKATSGALYYNGENIDKANEIVQSEYHGI